MLSLRKCSESIQYATSNKLFKCIHSSDSSKYFARKLSTLYSWGTGDEGQLGHSSIIKSGVKNTYVEVEPKKLDSFSHSAKDISMGFTHAAAISENGDLFTWGRH